MELAALVSGATLLLVLITVISRRTTALDRKYFASRWEFINKTYATPDVGPRMAVIEADKLLDKALKQSRFPGETMGDRLKSAEKSLKNYQAVWDAHKLRNRLVHEDVKLKKSQASSAISTFRAALKGLGAL
ncbi:MAG: hypothetical protein R3313_01665 [Candidatus Saccharimonadales bacterium]|nr:hypothetical protein [Candidatus Saccharimonadales bacterium]